MILKILGQCSNRADRMCNTEMVYGYLSLISIIPVAEDGIASGTTRLLESLLTRGPIDAANYDARIVKLQLLHR